MTSRRRMILLAAVVLAAAAGVGGYALVRNAERPRLAACYTGFGAMPSGEHQVATLRLVQHGSLVTGTYAAARQGLAFDVRGRLDGSRFDGTFAASGQQVRVTGTMQPDQVVLDDPGGQVAVSRFAPGCV
jgi:hypothetical protein